MYKHANNNNNRRLLLVCLSENKFYSKKATPPVVCVCLSGSHVHRTTISPRLAVSLFWRVFVVWCLVFVCLVGVCMLAAPLLPVHTLEETTGAING